MHPTWRTPLSAMDAYTSRASASVSSSRVSMKMNSITDRLLKLSDNFAILAHVRAAIWDGPGEMSIGEVADASCPQNGVLLRVTACGICGTDVRSFYNGDRRISAPWVLGHEISGELVEIGPAAAEEVAQSGLSIGDRVHCISTLWCGRCRLCRSGNENLCVNGELMGFDHQGAYAELVAIPQIALKNLFRIPDGLSEVHATFADPLSDALCGHKDIGVSLDDTVVVIGAGPVGTAHALIARLEGAGQVLLLETAAQRLELAREILGDERMIYVDTSSADGTKAVRDATDGIGADVVIVACSSDVAQEQAMEMAAPRGRVLFFGGLPKGTTHMRFPSNILHYLEVQVHGSYASRHRDQVRALDMLADDIGGIRRIVSDVIDLDAAPDAFPRIRSGEVLKVVVQP